MKDNMLNYMLIVSILLNFSLLGAAGYTHYKQSSYRSSTFLEPGNIPGRAGIPDCGVNGKHFFQELSLKPEQVKLFQQKATMFHETLNKKRQEVDRLRRSLLDHIAAEKTDNEQIQATIAHINEKQKEMQKTVVAHMLEFKSMLDKDQQKRFLGLIEGAMREHRGAIGP